MPKKPLPYGGAAKKRKKKARPTPPLGAAPRPSLSPQPAVATSPRPPVLRPEARTPTPVRAAATLSFAAEQRYVISDLKRIGVISAAMFAILIVLAFVAR